MGCLTARAALVALALGMGGCASLPKRTDGPGETIRFKVRYTGHGCPTRATWIWGFDERPWMEERAVEACGRFGAVASHTFRFARPTRVWIVFADDQDWALGSDFMEVEP